jgi:hypothetical protein
LRAKQNHQALHGVQFPLSDVPHRVRINIHPVGRFLLDLNFPGIAPVWRGQVSMGKEKAKYADAAQPRNQHPVLAAQKNNPK